MHATPQPLLAMSRDGVRGIFSDIDDTLTDEGHLRPSTYEAICATRARGLRVVLITGRPAGWGATLASLVPVDAVVAENGAVAFIPRAGRTLEQHFFDPATERESWPKRLAAIRHDVLGLHFARQSNDSFMRISDVAFDIGETQHLGVEEIAAIKSIVLSHGARFAASAIHAHATYSGADKWRGAAFLAETLWGEPAETLRRDYVFVGDSNNDAAAFAGFERSVGVANVLPSLSRLDAPPKFVTTQPGGAGFVELCSYLLSPTATDAELRRA